MHLNGSHSRLLLSVSSQPFSRIKKIEQQEKRNRELVNNKSGSITVCRARTVSEQAYRFAD